MKNLTKGFLVFSLVASTVFTSFSPASVYAAKKNNAYWFTYQNKKGTLDEVGWEENSYETQMTYFDNYSIKGSKLSATVYIPKSALKKGTEIGMSVEIDSRDAENTDEFIGTTYGRYELRITATDGTPQLIAGDTEKQMDISAKQTKKYYTIKAGKGKYEKFYILTIKNVPFQSISWKDGEKVNLGKKKYTNLIKVVISMGSKKDAKGKIFIDDVTLKKGSDALASFNFDDDPAIPWENTWHKGIDLFSDNKIGVGEIK